MKKVLTFSLCLSLLIIALSFAYYLVVFIPNKQKAEQEFEKLEFSSQQKLQKQKEDQLQVCLAGAYESYQGNWDATCSSSGKKAQCSLLATQVDRLNLAHKNDQERCFKQYPIN